MGRDRLRSGFQKVRGGRLDVKAGGVWAESGEKYQVSQGKSFRRDGTSVSSGKPVGDRERNRKKMQT